MTLRDYFAAKALPQIQALALSVADKNLIPDENIARRAYKVADAMLEARK